MLDSLGRITFTMIDGVTLETGGLLQFDTLPATYRAEASVDPAADTAQLLADAVQAEIDGTTGSITSYRIRL